MELMFTSLESCECSKRTLARNDRQPRGKKISIPF